MDANILLVMTSIGILENNASGMIDPPRNAVISGTPRIIIPNTQIIQQIIICIIVSPVQFTEKSSSP